MSSFEKESPGISPLFFNQKIEQNAPEKNIPSTTANAINLSTLFSDSFHFNAHVPFVFSV